MSVPTTQEPLGVEEIEQIEHVLDDVLRGRVDGVTYPSGRARRVARAVASALQDAPDQTLTALVRVLRRLQRDAREDGRRAGGVGS